MAFNDCVQRAVQERRPPARREGDLVKPGRSPWRGGRGEVANHRIPDRSADGSREISERWRSTIASNEPFRSAGLRAGAKAIWLNLDDHRGAADEGRWRTIEFRTALPTGVVKSSNDGVQRLRPTSRSGAPASGTARRRPG